MNLLDTPGMRILHYSILFLFYTAALPFSPSYTGYYQHYLTFNLSHIAIIIIIIILFINLILWCCVIIYYLY